MRQRFFWSGLGVAFAFAVALASPAGAAQLVFDVTINSVINTDDISGATTTTPLNMQYVQTVQLGGLPSPGTSTYSTIHFSNGDFTAQNVVMTGQLVTSTPLDAAQYGLAQAVPAPLVSSQLEYSENENTLQQGGTNNFFQELAAGLQVSQSFVGGDGVTQTYGGDLGLTIAFDTGQSESHVADFPPPRTVEQMLGLLAGQTWSYGFQADSFNETLDPNSGAIISGFAVTREYNGTATLDLAQSSLTPEPQAWMLMILGFGGVGGLIRAQRRRVAA